MRLSSLLRLTVAVTLALAFAAIVTPGIGRAAEGTMTWGVHVSLTPAFFDPADATGTALPLMVYYAVHDALVRPLPGTRMGAALAQSVVSWADFKWIHDLWKGPIVVKGVHTADDGRRAVDEGAQAIVVSNHGGRQLDGVAATIRVLPEVVTAVGDRVEVLMDGGVRRGSDIVKAICLGARAVLIGRAYSYGLAAAGERGVTRAIDILRADLLRTMALLGCPALSALDRSFIDT